MTQELPQKLNGLIPMSDADYGKADGVRKSQLDLLSISPATARSGFKEQTEAMIMGSLVHCLVLEPSSFTSRYIFDKNAPKKPSDAILNAKNPSKESKIIISKWKDWQSEIEAKLKQGLILLDSDMMDKATNMRDSVLNVIGDFLDMPDAIIEHAAFWKDSRTGTLCKCKPDVYIPSLGLAIDLKTTSGFATADDFGKSVKSFRYHVQQAFYTQGLEANGFAVNHFLFVPVSKGSGASCRAFRLDESVLELGKKLLTDDLDLWADCEQSGNWMRKPSQIETIKFKPWEYPQNDNQ